MTIDMDNCPQKTTDLDARLTDIDKKLDEVVSRSVAFQIPGPRFHSPSDHEIDLRELWSIIWSGKWTIIAITFVFAVASIFYALSLPNIYKSEALLAPAEENSGGGLAGLAGQFGGLASLAGVNLGGGDKTALAIEVLKSREFISKFIKKHELLLPLMASEGWDRSRNELNIDPDIYDVKSGKWIRPPPPRVRLNPACRKRTLCFRKGLVSRKIKQLTSFR